MVYLRLNDVFVIQFTKSFRNLTFNNDFSSHLYTDLSGPDAILFRKYLHLYLLLPLNELKIVIRRGIPV